MDPLLPSRMDMLLELLGPLSHVLIIPLQAKSATFALVLTYLVPLHDSYDLTRVLASFCILVSMNSVSTQSYI